MSCNARQAAHAHVLAQYSTHPQSLLPTAKYLLLDAKLEQHQDGCLCFESCTAEGSEHKASQGYQSQFACGQHHVVVPSNNSRTDAVAMVIDRTGSSSPAGCLWIQSDHCRGAWAARRSSVHKTTQGNSLLALHLHAV